jgi:hypothetical protein
MKTIKITYEFECGSVLNQVVETDGSKTTIESMIAFSDKQKASLLYTIRQIIDHTKRTILIDNSDLSDEQIVKMIEEDFFGMI